MNEFAASSAFLGLVLTIGAFLVAAKIRQKTGKAIFNPLMIAVILVMITLRLFGISYENYSQSVKPISSLLTPATICLAVPLYEQFALLKKHYRAVLAGIFSGVVTSLVCVLALSLLFKLDHATYATLLPKSITSAIGMDVSAMLGGHVSITIAVIIITGIFGNLIAETVCRVFGITEPIAKGVAIGTSSHALGTAKAIEMGQVEGAMSSLSIVVAGILTVLLAPAFGGII